MRLKVIVIFCSIFSTLLGNEELLPAESKIAEAGRTEFREIGSFQVTKSILVKLGETTEVKKGELIFRVFTDGIDVRISPEGEDENFLAFQIYFNGDIFDADGENLRPGVKALSDQGEVVRHLNLTSKLLTLTKFPKAANDVEITYATRYER